jgi:acyl carrier protein
MKDRVIVREFVQGLLRPKGDLEGFADSDSLIVTGRLDSVDTIELLEFLEQRYGVDFAERGFDQNDLDSVDAIVAFLGAALSPQ